MTAKTFSAVLHKEDDLYVMVFIKIEPAVGSFLDYTKGFTHCGKFFIYCKLAEAIAFNSSLILQADTCNIDLARRYRHPE